MSGTFNTPMKYIHGFVCFCCELIISSQYAIWFIQTHNLGLDQRLWNLLRKQNFSLDNFIGIGQKWECNLYFFMYKRPFGNFQHWVLLGWSLWPCLGTVYPKKYAHGFRFAVLCCGYTLTDFPISIRLTSLALWQSNDCPSASKATLMNMDKYFMWIHYERLHNHNKAKHNKTVCIFLGIYCMGCLNILCNHCGFVQKLCGILNPNTVLRTFV